MDKETAIFLTTYSKEHVLDRAIKAIDDRQIGFYTALIELMEERKNAAIEADVWRVQQINAMIRATLGAYIIDDEK
jgi:hypothetical protein